MKAIITADWHVGNISDSWVESNGLEFKINETFKQIDTIIRYTIDNNIDRLFILGDIFHFKRPTPLYLKMVIERLNKLEKNNIKTFIVLGNHSASNSSESAIAPLGKIDYKNIIIIEDIRSCEDGDFIYIFIPHLTKSKIKGSENLYFEEYEKYFSEYIKKNIQKLLIEEKKNFIFGHLQYKGATIGSENTMLHGGINFFPEIKYKYLNKIFFGHIHKHQFIEANGIEVVYPGSIVRCNFSERDEKKGFIEFNLDNNTWKFIELDTIEYKQININLIDKNYVDLNESKIKKVAKNKILKIVINTSEENRKIVNIQEIEKSFSKYGFVSKSEINIAKNDVIEKANVFLNPLEHFEGFVKSNVKDENKQKKILKLGLDIIKEAKETYEDK